MNTHHVVWDTGPRETLRVAAEDQLVFHCTHCGDRYVMIVPASVSMVAALGKQYAKEHARCKPRFTPAKES